MSEANRLKRCLLPHRWRRAGWGGIAVLIKECEKCRWQRAFHGLLNETFTCRPGTYKPRPRDGSER